LGAVQEKGHIGEGPHDMFSHEGDKTKNVYQQMYGDCRPQDVLGEKKDIAERME